MTKLTDSYEYQAEEARVNFQANLSSFSDLKASLRERSTAAQERGKDGAWVTLHQFEIYDKWLFDIFTGLNVNYELLHLAMKRQNINYNILSESEMFYRKSLKDLLLR